MAQEIPMALTSTTYHTGLKIDDLQGATYAVIPGDPERAGILAKTLDANAKQLNSRREYHSYLADLQGQKVLVCSTGIGGPAASIAMEELAELGIKNFLRVGTTGAIQADINVGDVIITNASVRLDGTSDDYAPLAYPAVASFSFTRAVAQACTNAEMPYHAGITASSASFYTGQERYDSFTGFVPRSLRGSLEEWQQLNVLNYEMESATVLTIANTFRLRAACFCVAVVNRAKNHAEDIHFKPFTKINGPYSKLAKLALLHDMGLVND